MVNFLVSQKKKEAEELKVRAAADCRATRWIRSAYVNSFLSQKKKREAVELKMWFFPV